MITKEAIEVAVSAFREAHNVAHKAWLEQPDAIGGSLEQNLRAALEAAAPLMLSHEREQTRLAHLDAMVNRETRSDELAAEYRRGYRDGLADRKQVTASPREWESGDPVE